jgi:hypothetical protein
MAEARRLDSGLWRIYLGTERRLARRPRNGAIATFYSLAEARRWWQRLHPQDPPLQEAARCGGCGAYIEQNAKRVRYWGRTYHAVHMPLPIADDWDTAWVADRC